MRRTRSPCCARAATGHAAAAPPRTPRRTRAASIDPNPIRCTPARVCQHSGHFGRGSSQGLRCRSAISNRAEDRIRVKRYTLHGVSATSA